MEITPLKAEEFDRFFDCMAASFDRCEFRSRNAQRALMAHPAYRVVRFSEGDKVGYLAMWQLGTGYFLEHLMVEANARNYGLGGRFLRTYLPTLSAPVWLEAEAPDDDLKRHRVAFYERNGFCMTDIAYDQPQMQPDAQNIVHLRVMSYGQRMTREQFEALRPLVFGVVYAARMDGPA